MTRLSVADEVIAAAALEVDRLRRRQARGQLTSDERGDLIALTRALAELEAGVERVRRDLRRATVPELQRLLDSLRR